MDQWNDLKPSFELVTWLQEVLSIEYWGKDQKILIRIATYSYQCDEPLLSAALHALHILRHHNGKINRHQIQHFLI